MVARQLATFVMEEKTLPVLDYVKFYFICFRPGLLNVLIVANNHSLASVWTLNSLTNLPLHFTM
jgi:hypothetical protein